MANNLNWMNQDQNQQQNNWNFGTMAPGGTGSASGMYSNYSPYNGGSLGGGGGGNADIIGTGRQSISSAGLNQRPDGSYWSTSTPTPAPYRQTPGYTPTQYQAPSNSVPTLPTYDPNQGWNWQNQGTNPQYYTGLDPTNLKSIGVLGGDGNLNFGSWQNDEQRGAMKSYLENFGFPLAQYLSNQRQQSFDNSLAGLNFNAQQGMNQFNMGLANRQQSLQDWLAQEQANQFGAQLGLDRDVAGWRYGAGGLEEQALGNERYGIDQTTQRNTDTLQNNLDIQGLINSGQLGQIAAGGEQERLTQAERAQQERALQEFLQQQQMAQLMQQLQSQELQTRYQTYGRSQAPNARMTATWG